MKLKHHLIVPTKEDPFKDCKLNRKQYAEVLTNLVNAYSDGFVMSINSDWGTGKTTFVRMWQKQLEADGFQTIYFNAWENDFDSNPLVAIISEFEALKNESNKATYTKLIRAATIIFKNIVPAGMKAILAKYTAVKEITDSFENALKDGVEFLEEEIVAYTSKKKSLLEFRKELEEYVQLTSKDKPLIFIIDELDRCRPSYSVEVLEQIKHMFSVPGIVFVLSIDKDHLAAAIKGVYGTSDINTTEYLRRFIDYEYFLPAPNYENSLSYFYEFFGINEMVRRDVQHNRFSRNDEHSIIQVLNDSMTSFPLSLRQQEQLFSNVKIVFSILKRRGDISVSLIIFLIRWRMSDLNSYKKFCQGKLKLQEVCSVFESMYSGTRHLNFLVHEMSILLYVYANRNSPEHIEELTKFSQSEPCIVSKLNNISNNKILLDQLQYNVSHSREFASLNVYIQAIDHAIFSDI